MGTRSEPSPVQPVVGILAASPALLPAVHDVLGAEVAPIELASEPFAWTFSPYYRAEMGEEIWRQFVSLAARIAPDALAALKHDTNALEDRWRGARGRAVNLDPGYLDLQRLVLASTKDAAHRVYLRDGIYAEATLGFQRGSFAPWPYTYRDYADPRAIAFFNRVRERFRAARAAAPPDRPAG
jgi:hypothetical protein